MSSRRGGEKEDVRNAIFHSAVRLFAQKGYSATTIRNVVDAAKITQPMVYYYFGNKEQLLVSCIKEVYTDIYSKFESISTDLPLAKYMQEAIRVFMEIYHKSPHAITLLMKLACSPEEYPRFAGKGEIIGRFALLFEGVFVKAKRRGEIDFDIDPAITGLLLFGAIEFAIAMLYASDKIELPFKIAQENLMKQFSLLISRYSQKEAK